MSNLSLKPKHGANANRINDISDSSKYALNVTGVNYTSIYTKMINAQFKAMVIKRVLSADGLSSLEDNPKLLACIVIC